MPPELSLDTIRESKREMSLASPAAFTWHTSLAAARRAAVHLGTAVGALGRVVMTVNRLVKPCFRASSYSAWERRRCEQPSVTGAGPERNGSAGGAIPAVCLPHLTQLQQDR
jgi:uncharacterized iron-regulated membrane protein